MLVDVYTRSLSSNTDALDNRKHALTLQLHTAHILSAHASLEQKGKAIQDLREQKNKSVFPPAFRKLVLICLEGWKANGRVS